MSDPVPNPDALSDAEKIRNKRLAKLGTPVSTAATTSNTDSENGRHDATMSSATQPPASNPISPVAAVPKSTINITKTKTTSQRDENPFQQLGLKTATATDTQGNSLSNDGAQAHTLKRPRPSTHANSMPEEESLEIWEDKVLCDIFRLSLDQENKKDYMGHNLHYVDGLRSELLEQNAPLMVSTGLLDQAILEAASHLNRQSPLDYLLVCWKRILRHMKPLKQKSDQAKLDIIKEAKRLCMSYCIFAITMPDMFGQDVPESNPLTHHLLVDQEDDRGVCHEFLLEITSRFSEDESAQEAMVGAVEELSRQLASITMDGNYRPYILALRNLVRYPALVNAIAKSPRFLPPNIPATLIESHTLLGPFFQISPLQAPVTISYFSAPRTRDKGYITNAQNALRLTLRTHQTELLDITNHIIKTSKEAREKILDWFARCVNVNHKRRATRVDPKTVSSDGFMINVTVCLDQLCEPFMDARFSKIDRIDVNYLKQNPRVDIKEETKLNADQAASDAWYSEQVSGQPNFISEIFFLTLAAHHYGSEAASNALSEREKLLKAMEERITELEKERYKWERVPSQLAIFDRKVKEYKDDFEAKLSYKYAAQGVLLDDLAQTRSMQFMRYVIVWLLRLVSPAHDYPQKPLKLPLPEDQSEVFRCLPEYFLEDIVGNFKFIMRNMPQIITASQSEELVILCITFLRSSEYIKNPYLKAGLVTILFTGIWPIYGRSKGVLGDLLISMPFATDNLLHAVMKFYIEAEHTGAHNAFYEKFNIRYEIFQIIKCVWSNPVYREHLSEEAKINLDFFVRFVNLLLNDVTYVLDESVTAFRKINRLQGVLASSNGTESQERTEQEQELASTQRTAKSYMQLANETVAMLKLFTEALADSFTMPEIVQRLADMLDYNLDAMVGPKSSTLKVQNPTEYGFNPKALLAELVDVYLNLRDKENFVLAVARDGRSYRPEVFDTATRIMKNYVLKSPEQIRLWIDLGQKLRETKERDDQAEVDLGDIPDEFLDPLMFTLMEDPVILPTSKNSLDRSTIREHLLSDPTDPFNRVPLKIEDVVPDTELKARIEAFKAESKAKKLAEDECDEHDHWMTFWRAIVEVSSETRVSFLWHSQTFLI